MFIDILFFIIGIALLYFGAEILVKNSSWLAKSIGISPLIVGLTIVAFGTSAPELLVSTVASVQGDSAIAIGNVIGSNIANIGLVLGLVILIRPPKSEDASVKREFPFLVIISALLFLLMLDGQLGRIDGVVLLLLFAIFMYYNIMTVRKKMVNKFKQEVEEIEEKIEEIVELKKHHRKKVKRNLLFSLGGLLILLVGSKLMVDSSITIAQGFGISQMVIGLSLVAVGTSLPELFTSVIASIKKEEEINVGMILGSNIFNTLLILGVAAVILPITVEKNDIYVSLPVMFIFTVSIYPILSKNIRSHRLIGLFMLLGYFAFIFYSFVK
ncbi:MAG: calcium/sodium antiporter [bacterium]|nr:calcium/sodium antiporter [bacterium]